MLHGAFQAALLPLCAKKTFAFGWAEKHASSSNSIIRTAYANDMPLIIHPGLLVPRGRFCQIGILEERLPYVGAMQLVLDRTSIYGPRGWVSLRACDLSHTVPLLSFLDDSFPVVVI